MDTPMWRRQQINAPSGAQSGTDPLAKLKWGFLCSKIQCDSSSLLPWKSPCTSYSLIRNLESPTAGSMETHSKNQLVQIKKKQIEKDFDISNNGTIPVNKLSTLTYN